VKTEKAVQIRQSHANEAEENRMKHGRNTE
jgi:hypothetical protein